MGINYWDYTGTGTSYNNITPIDSTSGYERIFDTSTTGSSWTPTNIYYRETRTRKILVIHSEHWTEKQGLKFVELVNIKTKTGWIVTLFIKGDVLITDPNVEKRTMEEYIPLFRNKASATDIKIINKFFKKNPTKV